MRLFKIFLAPLGALLLLASCGGSVDGNQSPRVSYGSMVSFGDSLSDIGTYKVGTVAAMGGGQYTVNGPSAKNWTELIAAQAKVSAPCAAQTGLNGDPAQGFSVAVVNHTGCFNYAQGGARVTNPVGPGNALLGGANAVLGQLTVPVVTQIANHLAAVGGSFSGKELVTVLAGGNDVFMNLAIVDATITAGGDPTVASTAAVTAMGAAGAELGAYIKTQIVGKGAKYVAVVNLPDVSKTPFASTLPLASQGLVNTMVTTFNAQLQTALAGAAGVRVVDAYTSIRDQVANPSQYGLTNVTGTACNLAPAVNPLGSSLVCSATNLNSGDVSHYLFADSVHPTPFGYQLLAELVSKELLLAGWL
jgi:phospholipase/lecithinase/hemolysin